MKTNLLLVLLLAASPAFCDPSEVLNHGILSPDVSGLERGREKAILEKGTLSGELAKARGKLTALNGKDTPGGRLRVVETQITTDRSTLGQLQNALSEATALPPLTPGRDTAIARAQAKITRIQRLIGEGEVNKTELASQAAKTQEETARLNSEVADKDAKIKAIDTSISMLDKEIAAVKLEAIKAAAKKLEQKTTKVDSLDVKKGYQKPGDNPPTKTKKP